MAKDPAGLVPPQVSWGIASPTVRGADHPAGAHRGPGTGKPFSHPILAADQVSGIAAPQKASTPKSRNSFVQPTMHNEEIASHWATAGKSVATFHPKEAHGEMLGSPVPPFPRPTEGI